MLNLVIWAFLVALTPLALGLAQMLMSCVGDLIVVRHSRSS